MSNAAPTMATTHPFDHLAPGPYRFIGAESTGDRVRRNASREARGDAYTTNMCGGSCDHCGTAIWDVYRFEGADGARFKVGSSCARKAFAGEQSKAAADFDKARRREERAKRAARAQERKRPCNATKFALASNWRLTPRHGAQREASPFSTGQSGCSSTPARLENSRCAPP